MIKYSYSKTKNRAFITILLCVSAISGIASDMYIAALPDMSTFFRVSDDAIKWTISIFFMGLGLSQLIYGPLSDYIGRKRTILFGFVIFSAGCLLCITSKTFLLFLIGRFAQGCGAGAATCISRAMMRDTYSGSELAKALSYVGMGLAVVPAIAPIIGGYIQYLVGWKLEFFLMLLYVVALFFVVNFVVPETNIYSFQHRRDLKEIIVDYRTILMDPLFFINVLIASFIVSIIYIFYSITSFYLQDHYNWTEVEYSRVSIFLAASLFLGRELNILLSKSLSNNEIILYGSILSLLASVAMFIFDLANFNVTVTLLLPISVYAIAGGIVFSNTFVGATTKHTKIVGSVSSLYGVIQMLTVFFIISLSSLFGVSSIFGIYFLIFVFSAASIFMVLFLIRNDKS